MRSENQYHNGRRRSREEFTPFGPYIRYTRLFFPLELFGFCRGPRVCVRACVPPKASPWKMAFHSVYTLPGWKNLFCPTLFTAKIDVMLARDETVKEIDYRLSRARVSPAGQAKRFRAPWTVFRHSQVACPCVRRAVTICETHANDFSYSETDVCRIPPPPPRRVVVFGPAAARPEMNKIFIVPFQFAPTPHRY